jgi:hypothetical protein
LLKGGPIHNGYSIAERMKFADHKNSDIFSSYVPQISTVNE